MTAVSTGTDAMRIADALLADPLAPARARARAGARVVGLVGADVPVELVTAASAYPVQLPISSGAQTPNADRYLEASFSPAARWVAEQWLTGAYDCLDAVIFPRSNDSAQRLYYYLCELQRWGLTAGPRALLYDLAKIPRESSRRHTLAATMRLAEELGARRPEIAEAIAARNRRRVLLSDLGRLRETDAPPPGSEVQRLLRASDLGDAEAFDDALVEWLQVPRGRHSGPRIILAGSAPPDERLHEAVERAGGCIIDELGEHSTRRLGDPIVLEQDSSDLYDDPRGIACDPLEALSNHYHALPYGPRAFFDRPSALCERTVRGRADGVVLWLIEEDEASVWEVPAIRQTLDASRVPHLVLARRRWDAADGALEAVSEFVSGLAPKPASGGSA